MTKENYKYIENRLNEMCKNKVRITYHKDNWKLYYKNNEISWDKIDFYIKGFRTHKMIISKKYTSIKSLIDIFYLKYLNIINGGF